jgi:hypothetical protein
MEISSSWVDYKARKKKKNIRKINNNDNQLEFRIIIPSYMIRIKRWELLNIGKIMTYSWPRNFMPWEQIDFLDFDITHNTFVIRSSSHLYGL